MTFGATEILIIVGVLILFFGAKKIPELARGIGQGIKEFKRTRDNAELEESESREESTQSQ